jgi:hypothetical protein
MKLQLTEEQVKKIDFSHKRRPVYYRENDTFVYVEELSGIVCMGEVDFNEYKYWDNKMSEQEFKVDKLGWYKTRRGDKVKILHKCKSNSFLGVLESDSEYVCRWFENGNYEAINFTTELTLVEYLGPELPKEPRKFEFYTTVKSDVSEITLKINNSECDIVPTCYYTDDKTTKWHVTMTEILEE